MIDKLTSALFEGFLNVTRNRRRDKMLDLTRESIFCSDLCGVKMLVSKEFIGNNTNNFLCVLN